MTENEIQLKAIAALTAIRSGADSQFVSDLLGEVIPAEFVVPVDAGLEETGLAVLRQVSQPLNALVNGFILAFDVVATALDAAGLDTSTEDLLQTLALSLAVEDTE
ncbi:hypothetical protein ACWGHM_31735 [Streptomyces sp. NPDC054904]|uniref:hypothetical protein n=1 Tax=unclassified Streptomyces TaxID=2593676 RepID=UPI002481E5DB|nr:MULTISPECIES: hypothetical protein [unclassified Streptomyces]MDA5280236.1 hypothetical protein [Streptomyces sp. Isolate_45]MDX2388586.1 hypothetical protein [Streptomyces sp. DK15]